MYLSICIYLFVYLSICISIYCISIYCISYNLYPYNTQLNNQHHKLILLIKSLINKDHTYINNSIPFLTFLHINISGPNIQNTIIIIHLLPTRLLTIKCNIILASIPIYITICLMYIVSMTIGYIGIGLGWQFIVGLYWGVLV